MSYVVSYIIVIIFPLEVTGNVANKFLLHISLLAGHLVFEMCAGYELTKAHPDPGDLYNCRNPSVVEVRFLSLYCIGLKLNFK